MKKIIIILALVLSSSFALAQDTPLEFSGSIDTYWKYDFAKIANIPTSFDSDQNSVSLGMIDLVMKKKTGKTSFVGEISFGPRGEKQSIPDVDGQSYHIQNLYATYAATDKLSFTAGYMATFVGYEVISPLANFNYSTSYLFTNGPFQNAGIKANYAISSKVGLMVGMFNDQWNTYKAAPEFGLNAFGAQLSLSTAVGFNAYLNLLQGSQTGTVIDLTAAYQISPKFKLGLNIADFSGAKDVILTAATDDTIGIVSGKVDIIPGSPAVIGTQGYTGIALYPSYAVSDKFILGLRVENFKSKKNSFYTTAPTNGESVTAYTLSANLKSGGLTFIPEFRMDNGSKEMFLNSNGDPAKSASQISLAMVYGF